MCLNQPVIQCDLQTNKQTDVILGQLFFPVQYMLTYWQSFCFAAVTPGKCWGRFGNLSHDKQVHVSRSPVSEENCNKVVWAEKERQPEGRTRFARLPNPAIAACALSSLMVACRIVGAFALLFAVLAERVISTSWKQGDKNDINFILYIYIFFLKYLIGPCGKLTSH